MLIHRWHRVVTTVVILATMPAARAELPHPLGRYSGMGWSDGYHSQAACPPKAPLIIHKPVAPAKAGPIPWWKIPASDAGRAGSMGYGSSAGDPWGSQQLNDGATIHGPTPAQP